MEETQENWVTHQNGWSSYLKYHLQLKTKKMLQVGAFVTSKGRKATHREMESKCLVNKYLLALAETMGHRVHSDL